MLGSAFSRSWVSKVGWAFVGKQTHIGNSNQIIHPWKPTEIGKSPCSIGNTSSNGGFSIVMSVFEGKGVMANFKNPFIIYQWPWWLISSLQNPFICDIKLSSSFRLCLWVPCGLKIHNQVSMRLVRSCHSVNSFFFLVGGFNQFGKIGQNGNLPQIGVKINIFETTTYFCCHGCHRETATGINIPLKA